MGTKHIFVTGGVVSSVGKGITGAALAMLLSMAGAAAALAARARRLGHWSLSAATAAQATSPATTC